MSFNNLDKSWVTPLAQKAIDCSIINPELYSKYDVKRGLLDISGVGVLGGSPKLVKSVPISSTRMKWYPAPESFIIVDMTLRKLSRILGTTINFALKRFAIFFFLVNCLMKRN